MKLFIISMLALSWLAVNGFPDPTFTLAAAAIASWFWYEYKKAKQRIDKNNN